MSTKVSANATGLYAPRVFLQLLMNAALRGECVAVRLERLHMWRETGTGKGHVTHRDSVIGPLVALWCGARKGRGGHSVEKRAGEIHFNLNY